MRRVLLILTALALTGCAAADSAARDARLGCSLVQLATMPLQAHGDLLFVRGRILGHPVFLLVDTGAERTLLTETAVERLHLPRDYQHATRTFGIGSSTTSWDAQLPDGLTLGGTRFPVDNVTVGRFDMMRLAGDAADGLLGADILLAFDIDLDVPNHRLTVYQPRRACPEAGPPWNEPYFQLTGVVTRRDRMLVPFELDGVTGLGVLDTGAQLSTVSMRMAERLGLEEGELAADGTVMAHGAAPDQVAVRLHRFRELRVGPTVIDAPTLPVVPMSDGMGDALVGADFLQGRRVWLSFTTNRVFVTRIERAPAIAEAGQSKGR
jgi:predicted aspartyl protease